jgi:hypothetical protein
VTWGCARRSVIANTDAGHNGRRIVVRPVGPDNRGRSTESLMIKSGSMTRRESMRRLGALGAVGSLPVGTQA